MSNSSSPSLTETFLHPLTQALTQAQHHRICPSLPDSEWLTYCVYRGLHQEPSGRAFLQRLSDRNDRVIPSSTYFDANATPRRLSLIREVTATVGNAWNVQVSAAGLDPLASHECLTGYEVFAGDGHYLDAAIHDQAIDGTRYAVGHFFGLDLRTHRLFPMAVGERGDGRKREHDMRVLKRMESDALRRGAPKGRKVIWVWDRAGIDAAQWQKWKQQHAIYFISRTKENMTLEKIGDLAFDAADPVNRGVIDYTLVTVSGQALRWVRYRDPVTGVTFAFLTSLTTIPPGVIAALYQARWNIEKVFDETKQKLGEKKSWGSSDETRQIQAEAIALTHNLMLFLEQLLASEHDFKSKHDESRRQQRVEEAEKQASKSGGLSPLVRAFWLRASQRGLRFIRWLRSMLDRKASLELALDKLRVVWCVPR